MPQLIHRDIIDQLVVLAKALPRYEFTQNAVFEDPAFAIHELGLEKNAGSAIVIEPLRILPEPLGDNYQEQVFLAFDYLYDFTFRVVFLANTPADRDLLALEFWPSLAGELTGARKTLKITDIVFGKEESQNPIFGMSLSVLAEYHTKSDTPEVPIVPS